MAKRKKQKRHPIDWVEAKRIYVEGGIDKVTGDIIKITYAEVARAVKASRSAITRKGNAEKWERERLKRKDERIKEINKIVADFEIPTLAEIRKETIQAACALVKKFRENVLAGSVELTAREFIVIAPFLFSLLESVYGIEGDEHSGVIIAEGISWKEIILAGAKRLDELDD